MTIYPRIVVVAYGDPTDLLRLLESIETLWTEVPAEIVVWDNGGGRERIEAWIAARPHLPIFRYRVEGAGQNIGFGAAVNRAAELAGSPEWTHLILLNPDATIASRVVRPTIEGLARRPGIAGLRVYDDAAKTRRQASARFFPSYLTAVTGREGWLTKLWPSNPWSQKYLGAALDPNNESNVDWVSGCGLWVDRESWTKLKGFDESYFMYAEDVDLGRKAERTKIPVRYAPVIDIVHRGRGTAKASWRSDYYHHMSMWVYHVKWSGPWGMLVGPFVFIGIWLRFLVRRL